MTELLSAFQDWMLEYGLRIIVIVVLILIAVKISHKACAKLFNRLSRDKDGEYQKRAGTLGSVLSTLLTVVWVIIGTVMVLGQLEISIAPIITALGIGGLALGFGGQYLIRDIINGFFILYDDQIRVDDVVEIAGKGGLVEHVGLRLTTLRDLAGNVHYVRNGEIGTVTNMTKEWSRYVFDIGVAYRENVDQVIEVIKEIDEKLRNDPEFGENILEPIEILGLDRFEDSAIMIKARTKTKPIKQWMIGREFNRRLKQRFDELDIEIPFPHMTFYPGKDKQGGSPSLRIEHFENK